MLKHLTVVLKAGTLYIYEALHAATKHESCFQGSFGAAQVVTKHYLLPLQLLAPLSAFHFFAISQWRRSAATY